MASINQISWQTFEKYLLSIGCRFKRQKGDHRVYWKPGLARPLIIPRDRPLPVFIIGDVERVKQKVFYFLFPSRGAKKGVIPRSLLRKKWARHASRSKRAELAPRLIPFVLNNLRVLGISKAEFLRVLNAKR